MQINVKIDISSTMRQLDLAQKQARFALAGAMNDTAFKVRDAVKGEMEQRFDRPTPYILRSIQVTKRASRDDLRAVIEPRYMGGKGVDPSNVLRASVTGGARKQKASERAFNRAGVLPNGYSMVPGEQCPLDQFGNIKGSFLVQLLSYFQAFGEQGYKANMTDRRKASLAKMGRSAAGYKTINGVVYFVAYGRLRSGRTSHLHPGIWAKSGTHGVIVKPIIMFVRQPVYRKAIDLDVIGQRVVQATFEPAFNRRYAAALATAR